MATILIVDDHVLNREFLLTLLSYGGHRLLEASDGIEGLKMLHAEHPDLVISDILMPNMDGYEFVTRMHADPSVAAIPVIFYTATYREREANVMALACGVRWVLPKPSEPEVILRTVNEALGVQTENVDMPSLETPPPEGSRFSTIENQLSEYLIELQTITGLMWKSVNDQEEPVAEQGNLDNMAPRLSKALFNLQAVSLRLTALIELGIELAAEHDPQSLVDVGCRVIHNICVAKYACVGTLDDSGEHLTQFSIRGLDEAARQKVGYPLPREGILGTLLEGRVPCRLNRQMHDLGGLGLPPEFAPSTSFLGVAIASRARVYGWLFLVDKLGGEEFTEVDERVVTTVATQMAVAYENLTLLEETQRQHTQLKKEMNARVRLNENLRRFRMAMDATADAILLVDCVAMRFLDVNRTACKLLGHSREELFMIGPKALGIEVCETADENTTVLSGSMVETQLQLQHKDGTFFAVEMHRRMLRSEDRWIMVVVIRDITERREAEKKLMHLAHYDTLTGLPNRTLFYESLQKVLVQAAENHWSIAVLFIDLDRFKNVNDTLGHAVGDELLRQFGKRLAQCMRMRDIVGRLGGDEFALILVMPEGRQDAIGVINKIREVLHHPFLLKGHEVSATASIGITIYPNDAGDCETLIKYADTAMYRAKEAGRDAYRFFTAEMNVQVMARLDLENALRKALDNDEFVLFYQPKVKIETGRITGVEALIRWDRPGHGLVAPSNFIPLLEEIGLIVRVGTWAIGEACRQIAAWKEFGIGPIHVSVNVSSKHFFEGDLEKDVMTAVTANEVEPELLELELTEATFMSNAEEVISVLQNLKALGVQISIDDFGTGYSSLSYLKRFPIDTLKIDIAFIRDITTNTDDAAITQAIISMAHSLKLRVIAEGVETEAQLAYLRRLHCDQIQGFYFSRPVSPQDFSIMVQQDKRLSMAADGEASSQQTLLIVDDDAVVVSVLSRLLRQDGYQVLTASTAAEGFELLAKNDVQVILCDQCMPVMNGSQFLNKVKDLYPHTFRIMLSGNRELQPIVDALNSGAIFRFYTKPWESKVLRENIRDAFRQNAREHAGASVESLSSNAPNDISGSGFTAQEIR